MPTTKLNNTAYRFLLPFCAPSCGAHPVSLIRGHDLIYRRRFESLIRRHHVLGSAVLLTSGEDRTLICTSSDSPDHKAFPDTFFRVASITKLATAVLAMRLVTEQMIDPDRPLDACFDSSSAGAALKGITLRHLLSHTAGIQDPPGLETALENGVPFPDILPDCRVGKPGECFRYSNFGFGLIGCVMEAVLGQPVGQIYEERLFGPLGMDSTLEGCRLPADRIMPVTRVLPYRKDRDVILTPLGSIPLSGPDPLRHYGHTAGSMYTDITSLQKLLEVLICKGGDFLPAEIIEEMSAEHASYGSVSPGLTYGYGLLRIAGPVISGGMVFGHQGFAYGCADGAFWEEKTGRSIIMLNGGSSEARDGRLGLLNRDLLRWAFGKELPAWS